ncbi:vWA domain-containing protein [Halorhabdus amylolytica]|uniref:vWA domain-containing protein n=1 Tax=Halorhabdus amylolytica TaxID=2559573 RepID=UPI00145B36D5|nr:vWA domain-containing protein [Halorhabdus amylolytica]
MSERYELSRRKVLAGLGTIGLAGAGAGFGTTAYFSDEETYENNTLTAGALDLTVDWEEHYYNGVDTVDVDVMYDEPEDPEGYVGLPNPNSPSVWVAAEDLATFMDGTSIEAYPDDNDDGVQDPVLYGDTTGEEELEYMPCEDFAQTPEDLDPDGGRALRSLNMDTVANWPLEEGEDAEPKPLVSLEDVKPGDFGELTLSFHLCDNPGYVWLTGELIEAAENGHTEPEAEDPQEMGGPNTSNSTGNDVELIDEIQTMLWYDEDGDNVYEPSGEAGEADIVLVLDRSGSMSGGGLSAAQSAAINLIDAVGSNAQISVVSFADQATMDQSLTGTKQDARDAVNALSPGGGTNIEEAIDIAHEELDGHDVATTYSASGNNRSGAQPIIVLLTDGSPNESYESQGLSDPSHDDDTDSASTDFSGFGDANPADNAEHLKESVHDVSMYTVGFGGISSGSTNAALLNYMATDDAQSFIGAQSELFDIFSQIAQSIAGEKALFQGSLRELLDELGMGSNGIPLDGNRTSNFDEVPGDGLNDEDPSEQDADARDCFVPSTTNALGLAWWLPVDHANEIQTDSVSFDLGFYTEQCRHNTGSGMEAETTAMETETETATETATVTETETATETATATDTTTTQS